MAFGMGNALGETEGMRRIALPIEDRIKDMSPLKAYATILRDGVEGLTEFIKEKLRAKTRIEKTLARERKST